MTSLDYQELRLMRARTPDQPPGGNLEKAADVEDLMVPSKAADEIARAQQSLQKNKPDAALDHLKKAAVIYPKYSKTYNNMGLIYRELGRMQEAETAFLKAIEINPRNATAQRNLGCVYLVSNRPERAIGPLGEAGRLDHADAAAGELYGFGDSISLSLITTRRSDSGCK
jgi:Flp pilus assembly protein TadD